MFDVQNKYLGNIPSLFFFSKPMQTTEWFSQQWVDQDTKSRPWNNWRIYLGKDTQCFLLSSRNFEGI